MNRNLISVLVVLFLTIGVGGYGYYLKSSNNNLPLSSLDFISESKTSFVLTINNPSKNLDELFSSNLIWKELAKSPLIKQINQFWNREDSSFSRLRNNTQELTVFNTNGSSEYGFVLGFKPNSNTTLFEIEGWKSVVKQNYMLFAKSLDLITLPNLSQKSSALIDSKEIQELITTQGDIKDKIFLYKKEGKDWGAYDLTFTADQFLTNGYSIENKLAINESKQEIDLDFFSFLPTPFSSLEIKNFNEILIDSIQYKTKSEECKCDAFYLNFGWVEFPFVLHQNLPDNKDLLIVKIEDLSVYRQAINTLSRDSIYLETEDEKIVRSIANVIDYNSFFSNNTTLNYVMRMSDFAFFAETKERLERLKLQLFSKITVSNNEKLSTFLSENISTNSETILVHEGLNFYDFKLDKGISINQEKTRNNKLKYVSKLYSKAIKIDGSSVNPKWVVKTEKPISNRIYVVDNHRSKDRNYLVQDENNDIYFINPNGEVKWKKNVGNAIIGEIKNIDFLGNGKSQMIFNTKNRLFLIDILGRDLTNFPVKILDSATANVSVMDYDNNQNFRFLVPTTKGIKSINKLGNIVKGWAQPLTTGLIAKSITHLLISNKDYIIAQDQSHKLYFYNRKGEERHTVSKTFGFPILWTVGSSIENSRAVFLDTGSNSVKRQFFRNTDEVELLLSEKKIKQFMQVDCEGNKAEEFVLVIDLEILIYNENFSLSKKYELPPKVRRVSVFKEGYSFINEFDDLTIVSGGTTKIVKGAKDYYLDFYKNAMRVLIIGDNEIKLLHI